jgi:hypothetical protein
MSNNSRTLDYADNNYAKTVAVETTSEANGYPANLRHVLTFDTVTELLNCSEELTKAGHSVHEVMIHRQNGWQLWHRRNGSVTHGMFRRAAHDEWAIDVQVDSDRCDTEEVAFDLIAQGRTFTDIEEMRTAIDNVERMKEELENILSEVEDRGLTEATVFYDPDNNYAIRYWADNDTVGYSHDTHTYQAALLVDFKENEEEGND